MIVFSVFITIICLQLAVFHLISFPLLAIQSDRQKAQAKLDAVMAKADIAIVPCNVTGDECGSCKNVTLDGGTIGPSNFSGPHDFKCLFTIHAPDDKKIQLSFIEYSVEQCCDFITVFDERANLIQPNFNGNDTPSAVTSPSNRMTIKFISTANNTRRDPPDGSATRWQAIYTFV